MRQNQIQQDISRDMVLDGSFDIAAPEQDMGRPSLAARLQARLFASRFDRDVELGAVVIPGTPLALHVARITSMKERHSLARALRGAVEVTDSFRRGVSARVPIHSGQVAGCRSEIEQITSKLNGDARDALDAIMLEKLTFNLHRKTVMVAALSAALA